MVSHPGLYTIAQTSSFNTLRTINLAGGRLHEQNRSCGNLVAAAGSIVRHSGTAPGSPVDLYDYIVHT